MHFSPYQASSAALGFNCGENQKIFENPEEMYLLMGCKMASIVLTFTVL